jgi:hypothetical protein
MGIGTIAGMQVATVIGAGVLATYQIGADQIGQVVIAGVVVAAFFVNRSKQTKAVAESAQRVAEIHVLVNNRMTEALAEIQELKNRVEAKEAIIQEQDKERT